VANISRELKNITSTAGIDIIAGSQLSRAVETRGGDKRPQLSDLRESGAIEQDASVIIFIYVPSYYGIMEDSEGESLRGVTDLIVAKNRRNNRGRGDVRLHYSVANDRYYSEPVDETDQPAPTYSALITTASAKDEDIPF
jgi:replicative DNA helicase